MAEGFPPYHELEVEKAMKMVISKPPPTFTENKFSEKICNFIARCLRKVPSERSKAIDLMLDTFIISAGNNEVLTPLVNEYLKLKVEGAFAYDESETDSHSTNSHSTNSHLRKSNNFVDSLGKSESLSDFAKNDSISDSSHLFPLKKSSTLDLPNEDTSEDEDEDDVPNFAKKSRSNTPNSSKHTNTEDISYSDDTSDNKTPVQHKNDEKNSFVHSSSTLERSPKPRIRSNMSSNPPSVRTDISQKDDDSDNEGSFVVNDDDEEKKSVQEDEGKKKKKKKLFFFFFFLQFFKYFRKFC